MHHDTHPALYDVTGGPLARAHRSPQLRRRYPALTPREAETALLLAEGYTNGEIARLLGVSPHTARHHTENVISKLWLRSRRAVRALVYAVTSGAGADHAVARGRSRA